MCQRPQQRENQDHIQPIRLSFWCLLFPRQRFIMETSLKFENILLSWQAKVTYLTTPPPASSVQMLFRKHHSLPLTHVKIIDYFLFPNNKETDRSCVWTLVRHVSYGSVKSSLIILSHSDSFLYIFSWMGKIWTLFPCLNKSFSVQLSETSCFC